MEQRVEVLHRVFRTDDLQLVSSTLESFERDATSRGHTSGFASGVILGSIVGVILALACGAFADNFVPKAAATTASPAPETPHEVASR